MEENIEWFGFCTFQGHIFQIENCTKEELVEALKKKFKHFTQSAIDKIIANKNFYQPRNLSKIMAETYIHYKNDLGINNLKLAKI